MRQKMRQKMRQTVQQWVLCFALLATLVGWAAVGQASTVRFDVSFSNGDTGSIEILSADIAPNAEIMTKFSDVSFEVSGTVFTRILAGSFTQYGIDSTGTRITSFLFPGPGRFVSFGSADSSATLNFSEGAVPGSFVTTDLLGGDVTGSFSIAEGVLVVEPTPSVIPLPASAWALLSALGMLALPRLLTAVGSAVGSRAGERRMALRPARHPS